MKRTPLIVLAFLLTMAGVFSGCTTAPAPVAAPQDLSAARALWREGRYEAAKPLYLVARDSTLAPRYQHAGGPKP